MANVLFVIADQQYGMVLGYRYPEETVVCFSRDRLPPACPTPTAVGSTSVYTGK